MALGDMFGEIPYEEMNWAQKQDYDLQNAALAKRGIAPAPAAAAPAAEPLNQFAAQDRALDQAALAKRGLADVVSPQNTAARQAIGVPSTSPWAFGQGGLQRQEGIKAPTYKDVFTDFSGQTYMTGYDPALAMTGSAGGQGQLKQGLSAFLPTAGNNEFQAANRQLAGKSAYNDSDMYGLANAFGIDYGNRSGSELQNYLNDQLKDYVAVSGLSQGWNNTGDARGANTTIYKRENGQLVPYQTQGWKAPEKGNWVQEHPGVLAPLAVVGAGLAAGGLGAAAGSSSAATTGTAAGAGANTGWLGNLANYAGLGSEYASLPGYAQAGLQGAAQNAAMSGVTGGDPIKAGLLGGITGSVGSGLTSGLSGLGGAPAWATNSLASAGTGALGAGLSGGNPFIGALGGGVSSGISGGLGAAGANQGLASILGRVGGQTATGLAQGRDLSSIFTPQQIAMLAMSNPRALAQLFKV